MHRAASRVRTAARTVAGDAVVILTGVVVYFGVRGRTAGSPHVARDHAHDLLALEKDLGLDVERGVQALLVGLDPLVTVANWVYIWGHWPAIAATFLWLALHDRRVFLRLRNAMIASGALGLCVYTTYPVAPPRLSGRGFVDTVTEQSGAYRVLQPPAFVNQYAAMPSLHVGWDLLVGLSLVAATSTVLMRTVGRLMPVAMAAATVVTANHYVVDALAGVAFGLAGWVIALRLERRRDGRAARAAAVDAGAAQAAAPAAPLVALPRPRQSVENGQPDRVRCDERS